ncbi:MAG: hypothetical protein K9M96_19175 [Deltaproteobacteria bacterium]|nr:hypothetical protein [Deltaproteobacteria bacterium]
MDKRKLLEDVFKEYSEVCLASNSIEQKGTSFYMAVVFPALTSCAGDGQFAGQFAIDDIEKLWNSTKGKDQP